MSYQRPPFWRIPHQRRDPEDEPRYYGNRSVNPGSPAGRELVRGDIISKIDDYDARDLRHEDAQNLFLNAPNQIKLVVQRDADRDGPRGTPIAPRSPLSHAAPQFRTPSPLPPPGSANSFRGPESLPRTPVPPYIPNEDYRNMLLSPTSIRTDDTTDESIHSQPYRTTPLVLPGAKVRREPGPTESYLRHHPNPSMRAPPHHDYRDTLMRQKVADSVIHRVGADINKVAHKQYNSPINLYSDQNIQTSLRQQSSPLPSNGYYGQQRHVVKSHKPTMLYDPAKSDTFKVLQEEGLGDIVTEVPTPVQTKVFTAPTHRKPAPTPKPTQKPFAVQNGKQTTFVSTLQEDHIQQSNSFKRLMYNVLGDTDF